MKKIELYPLVFAPVYKDLMWGGKMLGPVLGRDLPKTELPIGESWEIVDREDDMSIVSAGELKGKSISELISEYGKELMGDKFEGDRFPLLVKIIDAGKRLSLQVHPNEAACEIIGGTAEPKTEMWYIIDVEKDAKIIAGLKSGVKEEEFKTDMSSTDVEKHLQVFDAKKRDSYFIQASKIHAIGAGNLLLEIQQNSDTTYRVSDWGRVDDKGNSRELHVEKALQCIDFNDDEGGMIDWDGKEIAERKLVDNCPFFKVDELTIIGDKLIAVSADSFQMITPIDNTITIETSDSKIVLKKGTTCLIPANTKIYRLESKSKTIVIKASL